MFNKAMSGVKMLTQFLQRSLPQVLVLTELIYFSINRKSRLKKKKFRFIYLLESNGASLIYSDISKKAKENVKSLWRRPMKYILGKVSQGLSSPSRPMTTRMSHSSQDNY